jgi:hypothetical protein
LIGNLLSDRQREAEELVSGGGRVPSPPAE